MSNVATTKPATNEPIRWVGAPKKVTTLQAYEKHLKEDSNFSKRGFPVTTIRMPEPAVAPMPSTYKKRGHTFISKPDEAKKRPQIGYERTDFSHDSEKKKQAVHFIETAPVSTQNTEFVTTQTGGQLTVRTAKPYESLMAERDQLAQAERSYKRRIKSLEEETEQLLQNFDVMYKENRLLREKLETGDDHHIESYQRVYADREVLREAEIAYKKRIYQLDVDAKEMLKSFDSLYAENRTLRQKAQRMEEKLNSEDRLYDLKQLADFQKQNGFLKRTIDKMGYEKEQLQQERNQLEHNVYKLKEEVSDQDKKISMLERENEALKRGFEAIGKVDRNKRKKESLEDELAKEKQKEEQLEEQRRREELEAQSENAQDTIKKLREKVDELRDRNFDLKTEMEGVQKVNIALSVKNDMFEKERASMEARLMELAKQRDAEATSVKDAHEIEQLKAENKKLKKSFEDIRNQNDALEKKNIEVRVKNEILEKDKAEFEKRLFDLAKEMKDEIKEVKKEKKQKKEKEKKKEQAEAATATSNSTTNAAAPPVSISHEPVEKPMIIPPGQRLISIETHDEMEKNLKLLQAQVIALHVDNKTIADENSKLKDELRKSDEKMQQKFQALEKEKAKMSDTATAAEAAKLDQIVKIHDANVRLNEEVRHLTEQNEKQKKKIENLQTEKKEQSEALEIRQKELDNLRTRAKDNAEIQNDLSRMEYEKNKLRKDKDEMERLFNEEKKKLEYDLMDAKKTNEYTSNVLAELKGKYEIIQAERNTITSEGASLVKANEWQSKEINDLKEEAERLKRELYAKTTQLLELEQEAKSNRSELKDTRTALTQTKKELEILSNEKDNQVNKLLKELNTLKVEREVETTQLKQQGATLRDEVERLKVFEYRMTGMEDELREFMEKLAMSESRNHSLTNEKVASLGRLVNEMKTENTAIRLRQKEQEQHDIEKQKMEMELKRDTLNDIKRLADENKRLRALVEKTRNRELEKEDWEAKRNKFDDIVASNQRLAAENKRLLNALNLNDVEIVRRELDMMTDKVKVLESSAAVYSDENAKLRTAMDQQAKEMRDWQVKKDFVHSLQDRIKRQLEEITRLREELSKKEKMLEEFKELKVVKEKLIDSSANNTRLYEENRRLRQTIEEQGNKKKPAHQVAIENLQKAGIEESKRRQHNDEVAELQAQKDKLKLSLASNAKLKEETEKLRKSMEEQNKEIFELKKLKDVRNMLKDKNMRLESENDRLRSELAKFDLNAVFGKDSSPRKQAIREQAPVDKTATAPPEKKKAQNDGKDGNEHPESKQKLLDKIKMLEANNFRYKNDTAELKRTRDRLTDEIRELESLRVKVERLQERNQNLENEAERLRTEIGQIDTATTEPKSKKNIPKVKGPHTAKENEVDSDKLRRAEKDITLLADKVKKLETGNAKLVEQNASLKSINSEFEDNIREMEAKLDKMGNMKDRMGRLEDENRRLRDELDILEQSLRTSKATAPGSLKPQTSDLGKSFVETGEQQKQVESLKERNRRLLEESRRLHQELNKKEELLKDLEELQGVQAKFIDATAHNTRLYEENKRLREALDDVSYRRLDRKTMEKTELSKNRNVDTSSGQWAIHVNKNNGTAVFEKSKALGLKRTKSVENNDAKTVLPKIQQDTSASLVTGLGYKALHKAKSKPGHKQTVV